MKGSWSAYLLKLVTGSAASRGRVGTAIGGSKAERKMKAGFALAFFALLALGFVSVTSVNRLLENASEARKAMLLSRAVQDLLAATTDAETGQRGYLLTQDARYLELYEAALRDTAGRIERLRGLAEGDKARQQAIEELAGLVEARLEQAQEAITVLRSKGFEAARDRVLTGRGKELEDRIRRKVKDFEDRERVDLMARERQVEGSAKRTVTLIAAGSALACLAVALGLFLIGRDFAAGRRSEHALREARQAERERLVAIIEHSSDFIGTAELNGRLTYLNAGGRRMIGFPVEGDLGGLDSSDYVPEDWQPFRDAVARLTLEKGEWAGEMKLRHLKTGKLIDVHRSAFLLRDPQTSEPISFATVTRDITERKQSERRSATQNEVSRVLASTRSLDEAAPRILQVLAESEGWDFGAIWEPDASTGFLRCTETWCRNGIEGETLDAETRSITFAPGDGFVGEVWRAAQVCFIADVRNDPRYRRAQGARLANLHSTFGFPIFGGETVTGVVDFLARDALEPDPPLREMFAVIGRQIGLFIQRRRAEEEVRALNEDLEQRVARRTEQLEAANRELEAFSYTVSHDLRSPLRAVDGFSLALIEDCGGVLPQVGREYLATIRAETQRMGQLIDDLLSFSRLGRVALARRPVNMESLVRTALEEFRSELATRSIEIEVGDLPACEGDPALLQQVWVNLLSNAIKYTSRRENARVEVWGESDEKEHLYHVRDNGAGFDMRYADKLFGVFERLHRAEDYAGTGVGLAIVQRVIQREGGRVWGEGECDRGATFSFTIPRQLLL